MAHRRKSWAFLSILGAAAAATVCAAAVYAAGPAAPPAAGRQQQEPRRRAPAAAEAAAEGSDVDLFGRKVEGPGRSKSGPSPAERKRRLADGLPPDAPTDRVEDLLEWMVREQQKDPAVRAAAVRPAGAPVERINELLDWLALEQQDGLNRPDDRGAWGSTSWLTLDEHVRNVRERRWPPPRPTVPDTAIAGLALLRGGNTTTRGIRSGNVRDAAEWLYRQINVSDAATLPVKPAPTPLTARIGPEADSFLALLFFAELRDPQAVNQRYEMVARKLIDKIQKNQRPDGSWGNDQTCGTHAPLLGHALGVWALETASRKGFPVDAEVIARAGQYALSPLAEKRDRKASGKWKKDSRAPRPDWLVRAGVDDDEPVNFELYSNAARLCVLYQADRSNRWVIEREIARLEKAGAPAAARAERVRRLRQSAEGTRELLESARAAARKGWGKVHQRDLCPSPAPVLFTGEDFLACLMTVDAMAESKDVTQWFVPVVQRLAFMQDPDGGMRTNQHVMCEVLSKDVTCICETRGPQGVGVNKELPAGQAGGRDRRKPRLGIERPGPDDLGEGSSTTVRGGGRYTYCPAQRSWCSKDRVFTTAVGTMILLADTPYRPAFLRTGGQSAGQAAARPTTGRAD